MFIDAAAIKFFSSDMILVKLNAEVDTISSEKYNAKAFPTTLLIDKQGNEIDRLVGYAPAEEYLKTLVDYSNGIGTLDDLLSKAEGETDRPLYLEIADKYKYRGSSDDAKVWFAKVIEAGEPHDSLSGEARLAMADQLRRAKDYEQAMAAFEAIAAEFTETYHSMDADIYRAIVYRSMEDTAQAVATFQAYVEKYPESTDREYAESQIAKLTGAEEEAGE